MALLPEQTGKLLAPLSPSRIQQDDKGMAHLAAWDVRRWLIRIFGPAGWKIETLSCELIFEKATQTKAKRDAWYVGYRVHSRLTIKGHDGKDLTLFEDGAVGDATLPRLGDAHDMAMKTALSQSLKRCAVNLGDQFGLSLYNNGSPDAVVGKYLADPLVKEVKASEKVEGDTEAKAAEEQDAKPPVRDPDVEPASKPAVKEPVPIEDLDRISALCTRLDGADSLAALAIVAQEIAQLRPAPSSNDLKVLTEVWKERKVALS